MWSDRDTEHDCLGFESYVEVLSDICTIGDLAPLTLGIFGPWGSGKTSLMRMLKAKVDTVDPGVKTLWFNAWRYEGREEAQSALIHAILARLSEDKTLFEEAKIVAARLKKGASVLKLGKFILNTAMTLSPDLDKFAECFEKESQEIADTMERFDEDFAEFLRVMKIKHIVVFIDDLDRCSSKKVIETFETIKLFLNTPKCTFVIGADGGKIESAVGEVYNVGDRQGKKDYLEKIIQVPFSIPAQDARDINCYVGILTMCRYVCPDGVNAILRARDSLYQCEDGIVDAICRWPSDNTIVFGDKLTEAREELLGIMPHVNVLAHGLKGNPRQIKRFLNIVGLRRKLAKANKLKCDPATLIKLAVIEYVWDDFFEAVIETIDPETGKSTLIAEVVRIASEGGKESPSQIVNDALRRAGLVEFLLAEPTISVDDDLTPYLFLAQTSLSRGNLSGLMPLDDKAQALAKQIESEDPLRTRTASQQAAKQDLTVAAVIVRTLVANVSKANTTVQTHVINGLGVICLSHKELFPSVISFLAGFDPQKREAVVIAAQAFIGTAQGSGAVVPSEVSTKFVGVSKLADALNVRAKVNPKNTRK